MRASHVLATRVFMPIATDATKYLLIQTVFKPTRSNLLTDDEDKSYQ